MDWDKISTEPGFGYYDRNGVPISLNQWGPLHADMKYKRIAEDTIGQLWVSTVWLGLDHAMPWGHHRPLIFETMVFGRDGDVVEWDEFDVARYSTEEEARAGHEAVCAMLRVQHADIVGEDADVTQPQPSE